MRLLRSSGKECYIVGGAVRDLLLGYEKIIDVEVEIPICNNCNICLKCKENIFNINDTYSDHDFCKINNSYLHRECYKEYTKPNDDNKYYSFCGLNNKWELISPIWKQNN